MLPIFKNVKINFFLPNTIPFCQLLVGDVIQNFNLHYRIAIILNLLPGIEFNNSEKTLKSQLTFWMLIISLNNHGKR